MRILQLALPEPAIIEGAAVLIIIVATVVVAIAWTDSLGMSAINLKTYMRKIIYRCKN